MNWWGKHVEHTIEYAKAAKSKNRVNILRALLMLIDGNGRWGGMIAKKGGEANGVLAHGLMAEHIVGAKLLADQTMVDDHDAVKVALELLARNADFQAMFFGAGFSGFPNNEFRKLLGAHLEATAGYIKDLHAGDEDSFNAHVSAARKNAMELDQFTAKSLLS